VRELLQRKDSNAVPLLEILTDEMLQCEQVNSEILFSEVSVMPSILVLPLELQ